MSIKEYKSLIDEACESGLTIELSYKISEAQRQLYRQNEQTKQLMESLHGYNLEETRYMLDNYLESSNNQNSKSNSNSMKLVNSNGQRHMLYSNQDDKDNNGFQNIMLLSIILIVMGILVIVIGMLFV